MEHCGVLLGDIMVCLCPQKRCWEISFNTGHGEPGGRYSKWSHIVYRWTWKDHWSVKMSKHKHGPQWGHCKAWCPSSGKPGSCLTEQSASRLGKTVSIGWIFWNYSGYNKNYYRITTEILISITPTIFIGPIKMACTGPVGGESGYNAVIYPLLAKHWTILNAFEKNLECT